MGLKTRIMGSPVSDHFGVHFGTIWEEKVRNREDEVRDREDKEPNEKKRGFGEFCPLPVGSQFWRIFIKNPKEDVPGSFYFATCGQHPC